MAILVPLLAACSEGDDGTAPPFAPDDEPSDDVTCALDHNWLATGAARGGIPHLNDPRLVGKDHEEADYVFPDERVIGLMLDGEPVAVPHQILWWHEIVNFDRGSTRLAVTFCPLTGSSLIFHRDSAGGDPFIVSGLLYYNNLMMAAGDGETLYSQMFARAVCGPETGKRLETVQAMEMTWSAWQELYPDTRVVSINTAVPRPYRSYPYDEYREEDNAQTLFPVPELDSRRPPKERVLAVPDAAASGVAFPFGELEELGERAVASAEVESRPVIVLWSAEARSATAFRPWTSGGGGPATLTLRVEDGSFVDEETGSRWRADGRAVSGELAGQRLEPVDEAYVAFWFAWALFRPSTDLWEAGVGVR